MGFTEKMEIVILVVALGILTIEIVSLFRRHSSSGKGEIDRLNEEIGKRIVELREGISKTLFDSMTSFNDKVNEKLLDNNSKSSQNITDFRVSVNGQLSEFQTRVNTQLSDFQGKIMGGLTENIQKLGQTVETRMGMINEKVEERLSKGFVETNETFRQISERVKVIDEAQKNIQGLSTEMIGLQNILKNNQSRGSFGEYQLNQLLFSVFGDNKDLYQTQFTIREAVGKKESVRADAVIFMPEPNGVIAIDSKFPFSAYSQLFDNQNLEKEAEDRLISQFGAEVKKHITDISAKYIIPGVTTDYALMFVASDGILAMVHSRLQNVVEYAYQKKVTIVSPTTIIPLLSSLWAVSLDYKRSRYIGEIIQQLQALTKDFDKFGEEWSKLNDSITRLSKQSIDVNTRVEKITDKFGKIKNVELLENEPGKRQGSLPQPENQNEDGR